MHPGYWQSVTGSQEEGESLIACAAREVEEETGIAASQSDFSDWQLTNTFEIFAEWRHRYAPGITRNTEPVSYTHLDVYKRQDEKQLRELHIRLRQRVEVPNASPGEAGKA